MNATAQRVFSVILLASALGLTACNQEGSAEKAGQKVDQAIEHTGKKIDQAVEQTGKKMEQTKESINDKGKKVGEYIDDTAITTKVKAGIVSEPSLRMLDITVTTTNGVVRLSGTVDSQRSLDKSIEIVRKISGVASVENDLVVKSAH